MSLHMIAKISYDYQSLGEIDRSFYQQYYLGTANFFTQIYPINHVSAEELTTGRMMPNRQSYKYA